jgi:glutathione synthetase
MRQVCAILIGVFRFGIKSVRLTLQQLQSASRIDPPSGSLRVAIPGSVEAWEISVVYFRAGYTPLDFQSTADYDVRFLLEASLAIKCPSIPLQLAGSKKIQEFITHGDLPEQLLKKAAANGGEPFSEDDLASIRETWMPMWSLDKDRGIGAQLARKNYKNLVLKPQREGGGNNIYHDHIPDFLDALPAAEYEAWIAMELINTPSAANVMIKTGDSKGTLSATVSELGIYGWSLFDGSSCGESNVGGWLLRTKGKESDEGGVAVGISVLDSPLLM